MAPRILGFAVRLGLLAGGLAAGCLCLAGAWLVGWSAGWLQASRLAGWLAGWLLPAGWLGAGWLAAGWQGYHRGGLRGPRVGSYGGQW